MFDKETASDVLYHDLKNKKLYNQTFKDFIAGRKAELGQSYHCASEQILNIIKENINEITADELFELMYYLNEELLYGKYNDEFKADRNLQNTIYQKYGITLLYEIPGTTTCYSYMFQYGNYTEYYPIEEIKFDKDEEGQNICVKDFLRFNDYMILMMNRILSSGVNEYYPQSESYLNESEKDIVNEIILKHQNDEYLLNIIEQEFNFIKSSYDEKKEYYSAVENTVYCAVNILSNSILMKLKINPEKNTRIVIVDSL
ncbi:hypothetical protein [Chryseobacterium sp. EO14]|uniref:hypothetical protein n=1 Tax=Chryseobacterium sp. EO14 TaxID=2950551 RepID=UPI00210C5574|nr:hypothetical protein [Chryseobacterium sp. EO14]MCQ4141123.1 hypothetical protein [Chryseobacterium sp. EO14]